MFDFLPRRKRFWDMGCRTLCVLVLPVLLVALTGCATAPRLYEHALFFGQDMEQQREVTEEEWSTFLQDMLLLHFPEGMTVLNAEGYWKNGEKRFQEKSKVVVILAPSNKTVREKMTTIMEAYCDAFRQNSVLYVVSQPMSAVFYSPNTRP